jgi:Zn-dependent metalloprotease
MNHSFRPTQGFNFIKLDTAKRINPLTLFEEYSELFGLDSDKTMVFVRKKSGLTGDHYRFQCVYKGITVEGYEAMVHAKNGVATSVYFKIPKAIDIEVRPTLSSKEVSHNSPNGDNTSLEHELLQG